MNRDELFSDQYKKYLAGEMRKAFGYEGCPIVLAPKARPKTIEPVRKPKPAHQKPGAPGAGFGVKPRFGPSKRVGTHGGPRGTNRAKGRR